MIENYEFPLTEEIKELGISRVYTGVHNNSNETILLIECKGIENHPLQCVYNKTSFKKTAKELELALTTADLKLDRLKNSIFSFLKYG